MGIYTKYRDYFRDHVEFKAFRKKFKLTSALAHIGKQTEADSYIWTYPEVSVVIVHQCDDSFDFTSINSLVKNNSGISIEIKVISKSAMADNIAFPLEWIIMDHEQNVCSCINACVKKAKGNYILLLDSRVFLHENCIAELLATYRMRDDIGIVSPMVLDRQAGMLFAGGFLVQDDLKVINQENFKLHDPEVNYTQKIDFTSSVALFFSKWSEEEVRLNQFDEQYIELRQGIFDFCFQAAERHLQEIYLTPFAKMTYLGEAVSSEVNFTKADVNADWQKYIRDTSSSTVLKRKARLYDDKQIVFYHHNIPRYDENSGDVRLTEIIKTYQEEGYHIVYQTHKNRITNPYNAAFQRMGVAINYNTSLELMNLQRLLDCNNDTPVIAWFYTAEIFNTFYIQAKALFSNVKLVFDLVDIHHLRLKRRTELYPQDEDLKREYEKYLEYETVASEQSDIVIAVSDKEKEYMQKHFSGDKTLTISNIHYSKIDRADTPSFEERKGILFIGSEHHPNIDAVHFLMHEIMPLVWKQIPGLKLNIVGSVDKHFEDQKDYPNIRFHGYVPDVETFFLENRLMVAPLRYGAGVKGKIGQALEYYLPVVTTSIGAEGMSLQHERNALIADLALEFAQRTVELYQDKELWNALQSNSDDSLKPFGRNMLKESLSLIS